MKRSIKLWQWMGFAITSFGGTMLHFLYEWLGESPFIAPFSGVNESTWEHMKLLFWPMFIYAIFESLFLRDREDFWYIKLRGIVLGLALIPILFYTYNGVIGKSTDFINISIFFISAAASFIYEGYKFDDEPAIYSNPRTEIGLLSLIALLFIIFTFRTPRLAIFQDPLTGAYGI